MNITYIYHEYRNRRKRYADEMSKLGHNVTSLFVADKKRAGLITLEAIKKTAPDMLFLLSPFYIDKKVITDEAIDYAKAKRIPIVCYSTLNTQVPFTEMNDTWKVFDYFFAQQWQLTDHLKSIGVNAHYMPLGFYPDQYYPTTETSCIDISFMGNPQTTVNPSEDKRIKYVRALSDFKIKVFGSAFKSRGVASVSYGDHDSQRKVYGMSKINLDLPFINSSHPFYGDMFHCKNRFFEVPATESFLLIARCPEFESIMDDSMIGYYDDNIDDLRAKVAYYLGNQALRMDMRARAYREVINNHTFAHRFREMFRIMGV